MNQYSARDVERLVHLPRSRIRSFVEAGFVSPARGARNARLFSFQGLIVLRPAPARAAALEAQDPEAAIQAYERAIAADSGLLKAHINLGCLLHGTRRLDRAEEVYRNAMLVNGTDPVLLYDLGVLLDDMGRTNEAMEAYRAALLEDRRFADCHYNLALLCERLGKPKDAIQHLAAYRRLTATTRSE